MNQSELRYIVDQNIPASESKSLVWWLIIVCFTYHYKVILCGLFGKVLGYDFLCHTLIHGVTTNHWIEQLIYVPILWYALYRITIIVFGPGRGEVLSSKIQKLKTVALFLLVMYIYGTGIHFANTIEIYSREYLGITSGPLYDQVYWVDEEFSHMVQFIFYFALISWLIIHDRLDRLKGKIAAVFIGIVHGLERAIGVIEGDQPNIALIFACWVIVATVLRWRKHNSDFPRAWNDFFFRYGLTFGISMPMTLFSYQWLFNGFVQPSAMGDKAWLVVVFCLAFTALGFLITMAMDRFLGNSTNSATFTP